MMDTILMIQVRLLMAAIIVMPLFFRRWKGVSKPMRKQLWWLGFFNLYRNLFATIYWLKIYEHGERNDHDWIRTIMCDFHWAFFLSRSCEIGITGCVALLPF